jgi:hypothetical protein
MAVFQHNWLTPRTVSTGKTSKNYQPNKKLCTDEKLCCETQSELSVKRNQSLHPFKLWVEIENEQKTLINTFP